MIKQNMMVDDARPDSSTTLRDKVVGGIRWGLIVSLATQIGKIIFLVALMRLLGPQNFGLVGQATVFIAVAQIFVSFGLAASIVQRPELARDEIGTAFWLNLTLGLLLAGTSIITAPLLSAFFRSENLEAIIQILSVCFALKAVTVVPRAILARNMQFKSLGLVEIASTFISGSLGVLAAATGAGYWALVIQVVSIDVISLVLIPMSGLRDFSYSTEAARRLWPFSSRIMGADIVNYISNNGDKFLVARFLGPTMLGLYSLAFKVLELTLSVSGQAGRVLLPTFSRLQNDRERLARAYLASSEIVSFIVFPAMTLTILVAPIAVPAVFGDEWREAILPMQLVAAMTMPYILHSNMGPLFVAVGKADWEFRWSVVNAIVAIASFIVGLQWGIVGLAASYLIMQSALLAARFVITQRLIPVTIRMFLRALMPATSCSAALGVVWFLVEISLRAIASGPVLVAIGSMAGAVAYVLSFKFSWPRDFQRQLDFARLVVRGDRG